MHEQRQETAKMLKGFFEQKNGRVKYATVKSVSNDACIVVTDGIEIEARIKPTQDDAKASIYLKPKLNTTVLIINLEGSDFWYVIDADEYELYEINFNNTTKVTVTNSDVTIIVGGKLAISNTASNLTSLVDELFDLLAEFKVLETDQGVPKPSNPEPSTVAKVNALKTKFKTLLK